MSAPVTEKGYTGGRGGTGSGFWFAPDPEDTPELRWPLSIDVYDKMRRQDAQVMSVLRAVTLPIRRTRWFVDPAGADDEVTQLVAEDLGLPVSGQDAAPAVRTRDRFSWSEHLRLALTMLPFGHSYFEQVYRIVDGRARIRKLGWRPPRSIVDIEVADDGGLVALKQHGAGRGAVTIPVSQLVAYVNDREGGNWFGQSLLRPAYKFWLLKDRDLRTQAQMIERNGMGVPAYESPEPPAGLTGDKLVAWMKEDRARGLELAKSLRGGSEAGAAVGHGGKIELKGVTGTLPDVDKPIRYFDEQIARAVLAHFLNLGTETGSWALGSTFADFFTLSLQTVAMQIADVTNQHVVEDLVDLNWGPDRPAPRIAFEEIGSRQVADAKSIQALISCGAISIDDQLDAHMRARYGLPAADPTSRREPPTRTPTGGEQ